MWKWYILILILLFVAFIKIYTLVIYKIRVLIKISKSSEMQLKIIIKICTTFFWILPINTSHHF